MTARAVHPAGSALTAPRPALDCTALLYGLLARRAAEARQDANRVAAEHDGPAGTYLTGLADGLAEALELIDESTRPTPAGGA